MWLKAQETGLESFLLLHSCDLPEVMFVCVSARAQGCLSSDGGDTQEQPVAHGQDQFKLVSHKQSIKKFCITCLKILTLMLRHGFYV